MGKFTLMITVLVLLAVCHTWAQCPPSSQMSMCSPKCLADHECSPGSKCCPNICNAKSCSPLNSGKNSGSGYKAGVSSGTGTYCGNAKCNSFERCEIDRSTKKQKCVRG